MEWTVPVFIAFITLIQSVATEVLRRRGQAQALRCGQCGSRDLALVHEHRNPND